MQSTARILPYLPTCHFIVRNTDAALINAQCPGLHLHITQAADEEPLDRRGRRRAERAEERAAAAAAREAKDAKINAYEERRKKKDDEREARERAQVM